VNLDGLGASEAAAAKTAKQKGTKKGAKLGAKQATAMKQPAASQGSVNIDAMRSSLTTEASQLMVHTRTLVASIAIPHSRTLILAAAVLVAAHQPAGLSHSPDDLAAFPLLP
jgi:hypothetical protein